MNLLPTGLMLRCTKHYSPRVALSFVGCVVVVVSTQHIHIISLAFTFRVTPPSPRSPRSSGCSEKFLPAAFAHSLQRSSMRSNFCGTLFLKVVFVFLGETHFCLTLVFLGLCGRDSMFSHNVNSINSSRLEGIGSPYGVVFCCRVDVEADAITQGSGDVEMLVMLLFFVLWGQSAGCYA